jgi:hypothetical protein
MAVIVSLFLKLAAPAFVFGVHKVAADYPQLIYEV